MELFGFFKSIMEQEEAPVVICNMEHTVVYMNPASLKRYGVNLTGKSIKNCHNDYANKMIDKVCDWFKESKDNNKVFTSRNDKENKDVYMIALRNTDGELIGYYEKHEYRDAEKSELYSF